MLKPLKIIFLDIDGPMVPGRARMLPGNSFREFGWKFDPVAVSMLNFISWADPDVRLVVSSHRFNDPRMSHPTVSDINTRTFWEYLLEDNGVRMELHSDWATPRTQSNRPKHVEIDAWLDAHPEIRKFVTTDDNPNDGDVIDASLRKRLHLVGEDYDNGLTWKDFTKMGFYLGLNISRAKYDEWNMTA